MSNLDEALRRILDVAAAGRLSEEQHRELLAHLEDSVEAKVAAGASEVDAVARSLEELGDLRKIARQFPPPRPVLVTPEGAVLAEGTAYAATALILLAFFGVLGLFVGPKLADFFGQLRVPLPGLSVFFLGLGDAVASHPVAAIAVIAGLAAATWRFRARIPRAAGAWALALSVGLCLAAVLALLLPLLSLMESVGGSR